MIDLIQKRLNDYSAGNQIEEEMAVREILQEVALYGLWRSGFFEVGAFQGGTSLRILHGMHRFSEDLDFILKSPDADFGWSEYFEKLIECFREFGLQATVHDKGRMDQRIQKAMIKGNAICNQLDLTFLGERRGSTQKIKLEIDVDPPANSNFQYSYLDFPLDYEICYQDLSSNFALKIHALLCRPYLKGRDWFDFNWYVKNDTAVNIPHLKSALFQTGPWAAENIDIDMDWLKNELLRKSERIDFTEAVADVQIFLKPIEQRSLKLWSKRFFLNRIERLRSE